MNILRFLQHHNLPAGAVLAHIAGHLGMTQQQLAEKTGLLPQRINDYIKSRRRISPEASLRLEKALGIDISGYFYLLQANHDIHIANLAGSHGSTPDLSQIRKAIFWDTDINTLDWESNSAFIIRRIIEYGDNNAIKEAIRFYGKSTISKTLDTISDTRLEDRRKANRAIHNL